MPFQFEPQAVNDVILITPKKFGDQRGFFMETYQKQVFAEHGIDVDFVQDNHSASNKGVLRGLHYQMAPYAQAKLVRVIKGAVLDVAVDIRRGSPTYGEHVMLELSAQNNAMLWVPAGFAHGFLVLEDGTEFVYKTTEVYHPEVEKSILWSDPALNIAWPEMDYILSDKDKAAPTLANAENNFDYV